MKEKKKYKLHFIHERARCIISAVLVGFFVLLLWVELSFLFSFSG